MHGLIGVHPQVSLNPYSTTTLAQRWPNVGPTLAQRWPNVGPTLTVPLAQRRFATSAQRNFDRWANVGSPLPIPHCANVAPTLCQRCHIMLYSWPNVGTTLAQRWHNVILRIRKLQRENLHQYYVHK